MTYVKMAVFWDVSCSLVDIGSLTASSTVSLMMEAGSSCETCDFDILGLHLQNICCYEFFFFLQLCARTIR